ncbi:hypothetical protein ABW19_dt0209556 [Dactylella cylindrospora]|nr:hypothetical protein ABW19_dt0209556 [Dactylella cylindrospora]
MSRPANGNVYAITKLPNRKSVSEEKEAMNCKSCRKRKMLFPANGMRDLDPQKNPRPTKTCPHAPKFIVEIAMGNGVDGPKTELLEDLLRRIGHLEKKLEDGKGSSSGSGSTAGSNDEEKPSDEASAAPAETNGASAGPLITPTSATASSFATKEEPAQKVEEEAVAPEQEIQELAPTPIR